MKRMLSKKSSKSGSKTRSPEETKFSPESKQVAALYNTVTTMERPKTTKKAVFNPNSSLYKPTSSSLQKSVRNSSSGGKTFGFPLHSPSKGSF